MNVSLQLDYRHEDWQNFLESRMVQDGVLLAYTSAQFKFVTAVNSLLL